MYKKLKASEDKPKRTRKVTPRFETTPEWEHMRADLEKGLKPNEACQVILTADDQKKYAIHGRRAVSRFIQKYLEAADLPYDVRSWERKDTGEFYILVKYTPALRQRA